jgi:rhodanese-related sulfurtransferase
MRMYGFKSTKALKWGMSGWNPANAGSWNGKIGSNLADGHSNWSYGAEPAKMVFTDPVIQSLKTDGSEILKDRVQQVISAGFGAATASGADVLENPGNYFINNYFSTADYSAFGHINGAHRILPLSLAGGEYLNLDPTPGAKVITYCYTGQTSAIVTACLRVLGYDAYSLTFGMNGMYNTNTAWSSNQWGGDSKPKNYPTVATN